MVQPIYKPKEICSSALVLQRTYQYITSQHAQMLAGDPEFINYVRLRKAIQKQQRNPDIHKHHPYMLYLAECAARTNEIVLGSGVCQTDPFASSSFLFLFI